MIKLYIKQAWQLMKQNRFFSVVYVLGTALAISMVMMMAIVYYIRTADIAPELGRDRMLIVDAGAGIRLYHSRKHGIHDWRYLSAAAWQEGEVHYRCFGYGCGLLDVVSFHVSGGEALYGGGVSEWSPLAGIERIEGRLYYMELLSTDLMDLTAGRFLLDVGLTVILLLPIVLLATWYPARRASRMEPAEALHYE